MLFVRLSQECMVLNDVASVLMKQSILTSLTTILSLDKVIKDIKTKPNKYNKSGIYKLSCGFYLKTYVDKTGSAIKKRVEEHEWSFIKENRFKFLGKTLH